MGALRMAGWGALGPVAAALKRLSLNRPSSLSKKGASPMRVVIVSRTSDGLPS